ncbi:hypothetical protein PRIO_1337 [Paenibacillus riograndensis SBR5]|uniref:Uncharacterized protein n=1 Tax=Paenibacillus riograndensis SBR5 TaxID=1073571 RepID=A0A0E4H8S6_9BACL|nr:hypothetical protein PRIO_1337 [Paenibacillus riograndensis SBR5]
MAFSLFVCPDKHGCSSRCKSWRGRGLRESNSDRAGNVLLGEMRGINTSYWAANVLLGEMRGINTSDLVENGPLDEMRGINTSDLIIIALPEMRLMKRSGRLFMQYAAPVSGSAYPLAPFACLPTCSVCTASPASSVSPAFPTLSAHPPLLYWCL